MIERPFFLDNTYWYEITDDGFILTEEGKSIKEVVESYNQFKQDLKEYP